MSTTSPTSPSLTPHGKMDQHKVIVVVRIACLALFLFFAISVTWQSVMAFLLLIGSLLLPRPYKKTTSVEHNSAEFDPLKDNPLKGKPRISEENLTEELISAAEKDVCQFVLYDPLNTECLSSFENMKNSSQCVFAKRAKLWGSPDWKQELTLEENIYRSLPMLVKFSHLCTPLGLDGFLYQLPGINYGSNVQVFGDTVRTVLKVISDHDPFGFNCMDKSYIARCGWVFRFNNITFFLTTFAPFYPESHSRYTFGSEDCYILLQPEISFAQHDIPFDTPETDWEEPKTVRDKIRVAFKQAGRKYCIRDTIAYPMAEDVVKPLVDNAGVVKWWEKKDKLN